MKNIIVGTAGHIDHGKTALVGALTGIETDRLAEEKRRGISIDLGFAHLELGSDLRLGFVDVPGHERFVKNMLAGAVGIDLVLLVIAADESIKPQTREHFDICRLLGIRAGIVVLTKVDLVDPEILELVKLEVEEFVAGSFLEGAPVVAVSARTGEGMDELKAALRRMAATVAPKAAEGWLRLPIDRSFSLRGFGTVITGTLISGRVATDQEIEVQPAGKRLRVRTVQVHNRAEAQAVAGQRTALNVVGAEPGELLRGYTAVQPGSLVATQRIDCSLSLLETAKPLKHNSPVHFHAWTAETEAKVKILGGDRIQPGETALVRLLLRHPVVLLPGDRFIVRMFSPLVTLGGGVVVDVDPPVRIRRAAAEARTRELMAASAEERIARLVREAGAGIERKNLIARTGLAGAQLGKLIEAGGYLLAGEVVVNRQWVQEAVQRLEGRLAQFHRANPLLPGVSKEELRTRDLNGVSPPLFELLLRSARTLQADGEYVRLSSHKTHLKQDEEQALARILEAFQTAGLTVPGVAEVLARSGVEPARARTLLQMLVRQQRLVKVSEELVFHPDAIASLRGLLEARRGTRFQVGEFKEWTGISRKYAIPLLEYLDRSRITRREGDWRVVL
jgi:selenocysteine-specific elongation factor